jgi:uncharacterized protein (TIGR01244 family)
MKIFAQMLILVASFVICAWSSAASIDIESLGSAEINNFRAPEADVLSTGQPTVDQFQLMANSGVKHVINLRTPVEDAGFDEKAAVESLGMTYHNIPVSVGDGGINTSNSEALQALLDEFEDEGVVVHCATGNRVGALISVSEFEDGSGIDNSITEGVRWGMTSERLQQVVRENLSSK